MSSIIKYVPRPLHILLFTTQTTTTLATYLNAAQEQYAVRTALQPWIQAGWVKLLAPDDGRLSTFVELLNGQSWHLLILNGHTFITSHEAFFLFEGENDNQPVASLQLATLCAKAQIRCVVLAACHSAQSPAISGYSLATQMAQAGISHVIGMQGTLLDRAGTVFVKTLCTMLAQQMSIGIAVQKARAAMMQLLDSHETWFNVPSTSHFEPITQCDLPVLLSCNPALPLTNWHFSPQPVLNYFTDDNPTFIGRRHELRILGEKLHQKEIKQLLITAPSGQGKSALTSRLLQTLAEWNYHIFKHHVEKHNTVSKQISGLMTFLHFLLKETPTLQQSIIWLDNIDSLVDKRGTFTSELQTLMDKLHCITHLQVIITSRCQIQLSSYYHYQLPPLNYTDFLYYTRWLGLSYPCEQIELIYRELNGNFKGVQLLHHLLTAATTPDLVLALALSKRYLQACLRE